MVEPHYIQIYGDSVYNLRVELKCVNLEACMPGNWLHNPAISYKCELNVKIILKECFPIPNCNDFNKDKAPEKEHWRRQRHKSEHPRIPRKQAVLRFLIACGPFKV
jgi:hypothetical protein